MSLYEIVVKKTNQEYTDLKKYQGKVLLIVNSATKCGFTKQYEGLEKLYQRFKEQDFEILDFPCNQFFNQAPGTDLDLAQFCSLNYNTTFETFARVDVNGKNQSQLYRHLKKSERSKIKIDLKEEKIDKRIKWNFTKFLVDKEGLVIGRFGSRVTPEQIEEKLEAVFSYYDTHI